MEMPVGDALDLAVAHATCEPGHRLRPEVAAVGHDRGDHLANTLRSSRQVFLGEEVAGKFVVDFNEEVREPHAPSLILQPLSAGSEAKRHWPSSLTVT